MNPGSPRRDAGRVWNGSTSCRKNVTCKKRNSSILIASVFFFHIKRTPMSCYRGSGLDFGSEDPGSISPLSLTACGPSDGKEVKDVFGRPGARVDVGSAR